METNGWRSRLCWRDGFQIGVGSETDGTDVGGSAEKEAEIKSIDEC